VLDKNNEMVGIFGENDSGAVIGMATLFRDVKDANSGLDTDHDSHDRSVTLVELYNRTAGTSWQCSGLVLRPIEKEGSVYSRAGMFEFETGRKGQRNHESAEDWKVRIDSEFNWFKNCEYAVIEIV
jgi:hypothetical protein